MGLGSWYRPSGLLFESDPDPLFLAPDHPARQLLAIGHQRELGGDSDRADDIERRAGLRNVADGAIDRPPAAEGDLAALQDPMSGCNPVLVHRTVRSNANNIDALDGYRTPELPGFSAVCKKC